MRRIIAPLAVTLFAIFVAQPLFIAQLTCSDDSAFHIGRAVMLEQLIDSGHFFPRWSPHMAHGYGYPFFNYYGALSSYLLVALHKLGFIYPLALHIAFGLCLWLAGLSAYAFVREWWGDAAGVVSAVAYITAPYVAYDLLFRGNLAESLALALLPLTLFTLHRSVNSKPQISNSQLSFLNLKFELCNFKFGFWPLLASASLAALLYTHNATSLAAAPLFVGYIALIAYLHRDWRTLLRGGLVLLLGLALSAAFWLPALTEINLVQTDRLLVPPIFTYYTNYLSLGELLAPPIPIDPLLINPSPAKALGLISAILALLGLIALLRRASPRDSRLAFGIWLLIFGFLYAALTLTSSRPLWDSIPLIKFIQFPWRFLGPATLCAAALIGAGVHWLSNRQWLAAGFIAAVISIGNLSWWYPRYCVSFSESTLADTLKFEYDSATIGTTAKGEYLPRTVRAVPGDDSIAQAWIRGEQPQYIVGLPSDSTLTITHPDLLDYRATVTVPAPITLTFNQFFFPGWAATLDNRPTDITLTPDTGLITVRVPAGTHNLRFHFGNTPLRAIATAISIIAILAIAFLALNSKPQTSNSQSAIRNLQSAILILPLALILLRPLIIDRTINPLRHSPFDGQTISSGQPINANFSSGLTALSVEFPPTVASGAEFDVTLYAAPRARIENDYRPRFDVASADGLIWNNGNGSLPPRWHREPPGAQYWPVGQYAQWARRETILPGTPPGDYQLTATVFDLATLAPDSVIDSNGNTLAPVAALGTIRVTRPAAPPGPADLNIEHRLDHDFGPITLLGYNLDRADARPGDAVLITLFLRADEAMPANLKFNLLDPVYPTSEWLPGDVWRFQILKRIPAEAESGPFRFNLSLADSESPSIDLAPIILTAPDRVFDPPAIGNRTAIRFGDSIELAGYDLTMIDTLNITLLWHALATPDSDLSAFIHIEDAAGQVVAQSDAVPANWSRPTTGWLAGEYILDPHALTALPSGEYTIFVGLADRITGARLPTADGDRAMVGVYKAP